MKKDALDFTDLSYIKALQNNKISDCSTLKAFVDDKLNIFKMMISIFDRLENTVGKRRKCWFPAFSPFPTVFSKAFLLGGR